jgi:hypothetical protein
MLFRAINSSAANTLTCTDTTLRPDPRRTLRQQSWDHTSVGSGTISKSRSTSARLQAAVPGVINIDAPAAIPKRTDFSIGHPRLKPTVIAATIASPAPTPLPERIGIVENRWLLSGVASSAPCEPSDTTTAWARPHRMSFCAAASWSDSRRGHAKRIREVPARSVGIHRK